MGFKEVSSLDAETVIALGKKDKVTGKPYPKQAEGYYLGSRSVENKRGKSAIHFLQTAKGNLGLWGTTDLNRKLGQVTPGTMVRVTSTGTKATPNGEMYTYRVETDSDNSIDVGGVSSESTYTGSDTSDEAYVAETSSEDYEDQDTAVLEAQAAKMRAALANRTRKN